MFEDWSDQPPEPLFSIEPNRRRESARVPRPLGPQSPRDRYMAWLKARAEDNNFAQLNLYLLIARLLAGLVILAAILGWVTSGEQPNVDYVHHLALLYFLAGTTAFVCTDAVEQFLHRSVWYYREAHFYVYADSVAEVMTEEYGETSDD